MITPSIQDQIIYHKSQQAIQWTLTEAQHMTGISREELVQALLRKELVSCGKTKTRELLLRKVDVLWFFERQNYLRYQNHPIEWVREYYTNGFAVFRNVFDDYDLERLRLNHPQTIQDFMERGGLSYGAPVIHRTLGTNMQYIERILACVGYDNLTAWIAGHPIFSRICSDLWNTTDYCVANYGLIHRPLHSPMVDPHRDRIWTYPPRRRVSRFLLSIYLTGSMESDKGVQFIPGSSYSKESVSGNFDFDYPDYWDEKNFVSCNVTPYDAVIHNVAVVHYVAPHENGEKEARRIFIGCVPEWDWNHPDGFNDFIDRQESLEFVAYAKEEYKKHRESVHGYIL